jgi:hypothetical protein
MSRPARRLQRVAAILAICSAWAHAAGLVDLNAGRFTQDDDIFSITFSLTAPSDITFRTWSFAGGIDSAGQRVTPGGFAPVISVFDSSGNLLTFDAGGVAPSGCGLRNVDPVTGFCLDAYINLILNAGTYTAVLTQWDSTPNGPTLADGFVEQGAGNFTGGPFLLNAGPSFQRTGNWDLDISSPNVETPEPQPTELLIAGLFVLGLIRVRHKHKVKGGRATR